MQSKAYGGMLNLPLLYPQSFLFSFGITQYRLVSIDEKWSQSSDKKPGQFKEFTPGISEPKPTTKKRKRGDDDENTSDSQCYEYSIPVEHKETEDRIFRVIVDFEHSGEVELPCPTICYSRLDRLEVPLCSLLWHSLRSKCPSDHNVPVCIPLR